jgi:O-antigen/teichoic acid export membrane protein
VGSVLKFALAVEAALLCLAFTAGPWMERLVWPHAPVQFLYFGMAITTATATQFFTYRQVLFQAQHRPASYAVFAIIAFTLTAGCSVTLVAVLHLGVKGMLGGKLIASLACFCIAAVLGWPALRSRFHWQYVRDTLSVGYPLVPHSLMAYGLVAADRFILVHYRDLHEVGIYSVGYTIGMVMSTVTTSLNQAWAPIYYETARKGEEGRKVLGKMCSLIPICLSGIACFGVLLARFFMMHFVARSYDSAIRLVPWILGAYLMHSLFSMFSLAALQARRTKIILGASSMALVLNTLLNFALIPSLGMYGAAYATFLAYVIEAIVMYRLAQRVFKLDYDLPRIFAAVGIFGIALAVTQIPFSPGLGSLINAVTGIVCLGLLALLGWKIVKQSKRGLAQPGRF